jgi:hypothetical protein
MTSTPSPKPQNAIAPVRKEIEVPCRPADAFRMFTQELGQWWPLETHSVFGEQSRGCGMDFERGGEIYELDPHGERHVWGTIQVWEPPTRVAFTFHPDRDPATAGTVEVRFMPAATGTRVVLEHRGWELLGEKGLAMRNGYEMGWGVVFEQRFHDHCLRAGG